MILMGTGVVVGSLQQCAPRTGRSLLNFFFDGVPVADSMARGGSHDSTVAAVPEGETLASGPEEGPSLVVHYPYAERECESCHDPASLGSMLEPQPDLCYMCHEDLGSVYPVLHGPVGGGYCTACHDPHSSGEEHLLRRGGRALCLYCHLEKDVLKNEMHEGLDDMACTDCHAPHGGEESNLLY